jgi:hypothetical protein
MERKGVLARLGLGAALVLTAGFLGSCKKTDTGTIAQNVDFMLDLAAPTNAALIANGGYLVSNDVVAKIIQVHM